MQVNNFLSVEPEIQFPNINEGINCNIFLWLCCLPPDPPAIYSMDRITLPSPRSCLLGYFPLCNNVFPVNADIFLPL